MDYQNTNDTNIYYQDGTLDTEFTDKMGVTHIISYDTQSNMVLNMRTIYKEQMLKSKTTDIRQLNEKPENKMITSNGSFRSPLTMTNKLETQYLENNQSILRSNT